MKEPQADAEIKRGALAEVYPTLPLAESTITEISQESTAKSPALRKYIRKEGIPGRQRIVIQVAEQKQGEISISSLKQKFGLSTFKIEGIIRDAERLCKIRKL